LNKSGFPILLGLLFSTTIFVILSIYTKHQVFKYIYILNFIFLAFTAFFFRDPERDITKGEDLILSPADGKIIKIEKITGNEYIGSEAFHIKIFMSVFNVHVNRISFDGVIEKIQYKKGKFKAANILEKSENNEQNILFVKSENFKYIIKQVAGLVARRIVCFKSEGDTVKKGDRFGIIKFGSRVELIVPCSVQLLVVEGQNVKGGITPLAKK
jgi:phosphatidylserine decarboxylase